MLDLQAEILELFTEAAYAPGDRLFSQPYGERSKPVSLWRGHSYRTKNARALDAKLRARPREFRNKIPKYEPKPPKPKKVREVRICLSYAERRFRERKRVKALLKRHDREIREVRMQAPIWKPTPLPREHVCSCGEAFCSPAALKIHMARVRHAA